MLETGYILFIFVFPLLFCSLFSEIKKNIVSSRLIINIFSDYDMMLTTGDAPLRKAMKLINLDP